MKLEHLLKCFNRISWVDLKHRKTAQSEVIVSQDETKVVDVFQLLRCESSGVNNDRYEFIFVCCERLFEKYRKIDFILLSWVFSMWSEDFQMNWLERFKSS